MHNSILILVLFYSERVAIGLDIPSWRKDMGSDEQDLQKAMDLTDKVKFIKGFEEIPGEDKKTRLKRMRKHKNHPRPPQDPQRPPQDPHRGANPHRGKNMSTPGPKATISGHVFKLVGGGVDMFFDLFFDMFFDPTGTWGIFEDI